ncbi:MAG: hypothetical protein EOO99_01795 [Pedobacter sp.]|nr:MAG: hypothetical protein EOO99_01795 [Pedobacter sp.]
MKLDRIIWGIILLFVGGVLLLENFDIIDFHWRNIWQFWPVGLILIGLNIIFGSSNSKIGNAIMITVVVVSLGALFVLGQEPPRRFFKANIHWNDGTSVYLDEHEEDTVIDRSRVRTFHVPYKLNDSTQEVNLTLNGEGSHFKLQQATPQLFNAYIEGNDKGMEYLLKEEKDSDTSASIKFSAKLKSKKSYFKNNSSEINYELNEKPIYNLNVNVGAGDVDFDLSKFKVKSFNFNGGALDLQLKIGDKLQETRMRFKAGVSNISIDIPEASGCQIITNTAISNRDFDNFNKVKSGVYETSNFNTAKNKIFIKMDGGLSNFEVKRN